MKSLHGVLILEQPQQLPKSSAQNSVPLEMPRNLCHRFLANFCYKLTGEVPNLILSPQETADSQ